MKEVSYDAEAFKKEEDLLTAKKIRSRGSETVRPIRTFRTDTEELVQRTGTTRTDVVIAESRRREERGERPAFHEEESHLGRIIFILLLVLAFGMGVGAYVLIGARTGTPASGGGSTVTKRPLSMDSAQIIITDSPREQIMADISIAFDKTSLAPGGTREIVFVVKDAGTLDYATTSAVLSAVALRPPPDSLLHSLDDQMTFGVYALPSPIGYFVLSTRSYANTYAGMLDWEAKMARDLIPSLVPTYQRTKIQDLEGRAFTDERIGGNDARVLRDMDGKALIAYAFLGQKTLIIAGNDLALRALIENLTAVRAK
jgi:hypothetical protein